MTDLEIFESLRPDAPPLSPHDRTVMRTALFGDAPMTTGNGVSEILLTRSDEAPNQRHRAIMVAAAAAVAVLTVGGLVVVRRDSTPPVSPPTATTAPAPTTPPVVTAQGGVMVLDQLPAVLANAEISALAGVDPVAERRISTGRWVSRWYTATMDRPELSARVQVSAASSAADLPPIDDVTGVTVRGVDGQLYNDPFTGGRTVAFVTDGTTFRLTGHLLTDDQLLLAAEHTHVGGDGLGAVIQEPGLPAGVVDRAVGTVFEASFIPLESQQHPSPTIRWDDGEAMLWIQTLTEDPEQLPIHRLGPFGTVTDATVHDQPAFVTTLTIQPEYLGVTWSERGITYLLGSNGLDETTVLDTANRLRLATEAEWNELLQASEKRESEQLGRPRHPPATTTNITLTE